ncbi:sugar transferase [Staphylococcus saprophyticus]|uniref:sugar transferase n=1 Tax=Staphylococcus saprophyticus TaxID=29385 RepID=UPI0008534521|nr:sugar transferase [Staphylococcus saprophyticus]MDW4440333.1 sugar transferase [Staphylococcus saprophyticus]OEK46978.1 UDP-phosphate galactose phosphotransferase [Staphylococcus saprophyticus]WFR69749.1 sugar transferase [Staphylococcus saprophyticus]
MYKKYIKRLIDIYISLLFMPLVLLASILVGIFIKLEDNGKIFYTSKRLGQYQKIFKMYKFRSMKEKAKDYRNEDGSTYNSENDPRVTKIGNFIRKTSVDEIPQLINVLKGDMSLVGPRPDTPEALNIYNNRDINKLNVKPGITGYNQAYFRNSIQQSEKFQNDVFYVNNLSFIMDTKIVFKTFKSIIIRENINNENGVSYE